MDRKHVVLAGDVGRLMGLCFVLLLMFVMPACSSNNGKKGLGEDCQSTEECGSTVDGVALECRSKKCRTPLENNPPKAIASIDPTDASVGQKVTLDGSGSSDPENQLLSFRWFLTAVPSGSKAQVAEPNAQKTTIVPDLAGEYKIQLEVGDGKSKAKSVEILLRAKEGNNAPPVANAGADIQKEPGETVQLDGSGSTDPEGETLSFLWKFVTKPDGSTVNLENPDTAKPSFKADKEGRYILELEVSDPRKATSTDRVTVEILKDLYLEPEVTSVTPSQGTIETTVDVVVKGDKFTQDAKVTIATKTYPATFISRQELKTSLDLSGLTPGDLELTVANPNGKRSKPVTFKVQDIPIPELTKLDPEFSFEGVKEVTIKVIGKNFVSTSEVLFTTTQLLTTFKSETELEAKLNLSQTGRGDYTIAVRSPGGRLSTNKLTFKVLEQMPAPVLNVLNPPSGKAGERIDFSAHGTGFSEGAVIVFNDKPIPTKRIRRDEVQADPKLDLSSYNDGEYKVWVKNPDGNISNKETFTVIGKNPVPVIDRILPFNVFIGTDTKLTIYGSRFDAAKAKFLIGQTEYPIDRNRSSATYLEATVDTTKGTWSSGDFDAYVVNPGATPAEDKKSAPFKLTITHPTPSIDAITPGGWSLGCDADVLVTGRNFVQASKLFFGSTEFSINPSNAEFKLTVDAGGEKMSFKLLKKNLSLTTYNVYVENGPNAKSSTVPFPIRNNTELPGIREIRPGVGAADTVVSVVLYYISSPTVMYFRPGAVAYLNGVKMPTVCSLSSANDYCYDLTVTLDLTGIKPGSHQITVANPCGQPSQPMSFLVLDPPDPMISQISPAYVTVGDQKSLTIKGINFSKNAKIWVGSAAYDIAFTSETEISTKTPIDFKTPGVLELYVVNGNSKQTIKVPYSVFPPNTPLTITQLSSHTLKRGQVHSNILIQGSGFSSNSKVYVNGSVVASTFQTTAQITISQLDFRTIKASTLRVYVEENGQKSNEVTLLAEPLPPPIISYLSPASYQVGQASTTYLYIYGDLFCSGTSSCSVNPTVHVTGPDNKNYSANFKISYSYSTFIRGDFSMTGLRSGAYQFVVEIPTGERSGPGIFQLTPPPPPVATSLSPPLAYRGNDQQQVNIIGSNFDISNDIVVFNNDIINPLVPDAKTSTSTSLRITVNLTKVRYGGKYPLYVKRCKDTGCTQFDKTQEVFLNVEDPPCSAGGVNCATDMTPAGSEGCATINSQQVCRPKCTITADCTKLLGAPTTATCTSGFCQ